MAQAAAKYAQEDSGDAEKPLKVCSEAGRKCVRNIHSYPILSAEWIHLVDSLKQLQRLVQLEGRMPANTKVSEAAGRNTDSDGTLWDQEANENAIRILVEEAKVNLSLRMMHEYKRWQYNPAERTGTILEAVRTGELNEPQLDQKCRQFEESLGTLLLRAFMHVETLQLMDVSLLIEHCQLVYEAVKRLGPDAAVGRERTLQETLVVHYFSSLMKHAEALNNDELLAKAKELRLIHLAVDHALTNEYPSDLRDAVAEGFSALADNEDFRTGWEGFFQPGNDGVDERTLKDKFLELEAKITAPMMAEYPDRKKDIRPLLDFFKAVKRTL